MSVKIKVPSAQELDERQRVEDERAYLASATGVAYLPSDDALVIHMQSGTVVHVPRRLIDEIATAFIETLQSELALGVDGDVLSVRSLDVNISIAGLLRDRFGLNIRRLGGLAKTAAKAHAAGVNGARCGRPKDAVPTLPSGQLSTRR